MAGNEVDYSAFIKFFTDVTESAGDAGNTAESLRDISGGQVTGGVGIDPALSFRALNRQAIRSINAFMSEQTEGRVFLAEAAAATALAYHDGDLNQKGAVSDVMNGILNPQGHKGTAQDKYFGEQGGENGGTGSGENGEAPEGYVPPPLVNANGDVVDSEGRILFNADGTPGNQEALDDAGIDPDNPGTTSPYMQYINRVNETQMQYYSQYTGIPVSQLKAGQVSRFEDPEDSEPLPAGTQSVQETYVELVKPTDATGDDPGTAEAPEDPDDLGGYEAPEPETPATTTSPGPHGGPTAVPQ